MPVRTKDLDKAIAEVIGTFEGVEEIIALLREGIVNYLQRKGIGGLADRLDGKSLLFQLLPGMMQCVKRGSAGNTRLLPPAKMLLVPMNFFSSGERMTEQMRNILACVLIFCCSFLVGMICPFMRVERIYFDLF